MYLCLEPTTDWDGKIDVKRLRNVLSTARSQVTSIQGTVKDMIQEQAVKCKQAGRIEKKSSYSFRTIFANRL